jgi:starch synthase
VSQYKKKPIVWIFSFEFADIIKVGGLGEVPANQAKWLSDRYNITLFIPSHNVHNDPKISENLNLKKLDLELQTRVYNLRAHCSALSEDIVINYYQGKLKDVNVVVIVGANETASKILNDPVVYSPESLDGKFILYSLALKYYIQKCIEKNIAELPKIIHCHDHHGVPAMINVRQQLSLVKKDCATVITIHLMTWPRKSFDYLKTCGIEDIALDFYIGDEHRKMNFWDLYYFCRGNENEDPTLEKIGVFVADMVTSVSEDYLKMDVVSRIGGGWINGKSDFMWNGCDWDYDRNFEEVKKRFFDELNALDKINPFDRANLRKFLLTKALNTMPENEPMFDSKRIKDYVSTNFHGFPYRPNADGTYAGKVTAFNEDGPLIMMTGRISSQKGIDTALYAFPKILVKHRNVKFIISLMPTEYSIDEMQKYYDMSRKFPNNIRILFGKSGHIFNLLHQAADVYCAPSRWEPFGIIALEAMISKVPVVATYAGGLQESIIDLFKDPKNGTGILIPIDDVDKLSNAIINMISILKVDELNRNKLLTPEGKENYISVMTDPQLTAEVNKDSSYGLKIRENCKKRVETIFRWKNVSEKVVSIYNQAVKNRGIEW